MNFKRAAAGLALGLVPAALMGCPAVSDYDTGFVAGFAEDAEYWQGFDDSWDTRDGGDIYYSGSSIPEYTDNSYEAGYWDGVWFAYNDGYFVAYDYAFTIGFSEGYDAAYASDYASFLKSDTHVEWLDGGFTDGYNDGFSEGRVFGAYDYANNIAFDWLDAMLDYRDGVDLTVAGVSTGAKGPVELYQYGVDPLDLLKGVKRAPRATDRPLPAIRRLDKQADPPELSYRALIPEVQTALNTRPSDTARGGRKVTMNTTWLQRVNAYRSAIQ
jgi:hypothetical protein